eukprot:10973490-Alexandrium_andersonii.AAC.1
MPAQVAHLLGASLPPRGAGVPAWRTTVAVSAGRRGAMPRPETPWRAAPHAQTSGTQITRAH